VPEAWKAGVTPGAHLGTDAGFVLGASGGLEYLVAPAAHLLFELGYQVGFQRATLSSAPGQSEAAGYAKRYPQDGAGLGLTLGR